MLAGLALAAHVTRLRCAARRRSEGMPQRAEAPSARPALARVPEVHDRVGAVRAPRLGVEVAQRLAHDEVAAEPRVAVAQRAHVHVGLRPRPDARHRDELVEWDAGQRAQRLAPPRPASRTTLSGAAAIASAVGKRCVIVPRGRASGSPAAATSRPACVRPAATEICCVSTARTAISSPSPPGTRRPGVKPSARVARARRRSPRAGASRSSSSATLRDRLALVARVVEVELGVHAAVGRGERDDARAVREPQRAPVRVDVLDARHGAVGEERERRLGEEGRPPGEEARDARAARAHAGSAAAAFCAFSASRCSRPAAMTSLKERNLKIQITDASPMPNVSAAIAICWPTE